jgi:signal transduction histidine kinase
VFGWIAAASVGAGIWNGNLVNGAALLVALYTVASLRPRRDALACVVVLEVATVIGLFVDGGGRWWFDVIFASGMIAAALALGLYIAARRAYLAELHDRAERLERERDQQAALAAAAERARIAREMHDIVAHHLTVMVTLSDAAIAASETSPDRATDVMRTVSATGRRALADTRRLIGVLYQRSGAGSGEALQPVPDLAQLDTLIEQVRSAGLATTLEVHGAAVDDVSPGLQLTVYRIVQEALTNTLKHGGAGAHASVRLQFLPGELRVDIDDDGAGARATVPATSGSGLVGMRERVRAYGGDVHAGPRQPEGWKVSATLNLDAGGTA